MSNKDYYNILGVDKNASKDEIKKAFRGLAHKYHPDKKGGDEKRFKEIGEAYSVLGDDKKRAEYDAYGRTFNGSGGGQPHGGFDFSGFSQGFGGGQHVEFDLGDIFGDIFGGGGRGAERKRGRDISIDIELTFKESVFGVERRVLLMKTGTCDVCKGSGAKVGTETVTCERCNGAGKVHETKQTMFGAFSTTRECEVCFGKGSIPKEKCPTCKGLGVTRREEEMTIAVPAGINNGEMIRMTGGGEAVPGGVPGDLYVKIHVKQDSRFKKEGFDIVIPLSIKLTDTLLGSSQKIETLDGELTLKIPQGVTFGERLRIKGRGVPKGSGRGDLYVKIEIQVPNKLSRSAKKAAEMLRDEGI
ncbi:TPA: molecular chaperone DnaJ [Patescibacteria group bacterium]|nr:MAG: chaperone protein DnaJ [Parcubacteria group bacterium GW2011_GWD2_42_14]HCC05662.1 molecular chaperone DnaJ [Patescibacteria group bacterium]